MTVSAPGEQRDKNNWWRDLPSWDHSSTSQKGRFSFSEFWFLRCPVPLLLLPHHRIACRLRFERLDNKTKGHFLTLCVSVMPFSVSWAWAKVLLLDHFLFAPQCSFLFWTTLRWGWEILQGKHGKLTTDLAILYVLIFFLIYMLLFTFQRYQIAVS